MFLLVLRPLVFMLLYVNDFSGTVSTNCDVVHFAAETSILCHAKNKAMRRTKLEAEDALRQTDQNTNQNRLTLNEQKTEITGFQS